MKSPGDPDCAGLHDIGLGGPLANDSDSGGEEKQSPSSALAPGGVLMGVKAGRPEDPTETPWS